MIGIEDAPHTYDYDGYFKILPAIHRWSDDPARISNGAKVAAGFHLSVGQQSGMDERRYAPASGSR